MYYVATTVTLEIDFDKLIRNNMILQKINITSCYRTPECFLRLKYRILEIKIKLSLIQLGFT